MRIKCMLPVVIVLMILSVVLCTQTQTAMGGGAGGGMGGGRGAGMGGGRGGGAGGGMGGTMGGGRTMTVVTQRPDKATRLAAIADIEKQLVALKEAINKSQAKDPCIPTLTGEDLTNFTAQYNAENDAITQIVTSLNSIHPMIGRGGMMGGAGLTTEQIAELTTLAKDEKAAKTVARLEALATEAAVAPTMNRGTGGGTRGGGTRARVPEGGFEWMD